MQCYRFYKIPDKKRKGELEQYNEYNLEDVYPLYAITNDKALAEKFMSQRNMDRFLLFKTKMKRKDYAIYANRRRNTVLKEASLITAINKGTKKEKMINVKVVMTEDENMMITDDPYIPCIQNDDGFWSCIGSIICNTSIFKKKYKKALEYIFWKDHYKLYVQYFIQNLDIDDEADDYSVPSYYIDELGLFVDTFGKLL